MTKPIKVAYHGGRTVVVRGTKDLKKFGGRVVRDAVKIVTLGKK